MRSIKITLLVILILLYKLLFFGIIISATGKKRKPSEHPEEKVEFLLF